MSGKAERPPASAERQRSEPSSAFRDGVIALLVAAHDEQIRVLLAQGHCSSDYDRAANGWIAALASLKSPPRG